MSHSMDCFSSSGSTRVSSNSPSTTSPSFGTTAPHTTVPYNLFSNDYHHDGSLVFDNSSNGTVAYPGVLFGSPHVATQQAVEMAARHCQNPPTVQMHNLSLSSPPFSPCGPVTFVSPSGLVAPRPVSSSPPLIGRGWPAPLQPPPVLVNDFPSNPPPQAPPVIPPRPSGHAKIPPEKGRKSFPCLQAGCGMKFPKRNALVQHMRSHTGERPEVCEYCDRAFSLKCNLRRHYRTCKKKKAMEAALVAKNKPSSSPPPFDPSPSPSASTPSTTAMATFHTPPAEHFESSSIPWVPGYSVPPAFQASTIDMNFASLFPPPFAYPLPTLVQAQF